MVKQEIPEGKIRIRWKQLVFIFLLAAGLFAGGHFYFIHQRDDILRIHEEVLSAVSTFKVQEIRNWISERKADCEYFAENPEFLSRFRKLAKYPGIKGYQETIRNYLAPVKRNHEYTNIVLFNPDGRKLLALVDNVPGPWTEGLNKKGMELPPAGKVFLTDIRKSRNGKQFLTAVAALATGGTIDGYAVFYIDPARTLFSTLATWPVKRKTAENILLYHDGVSTFYLSDSKLLPDTDISNSTPSFAEEINQPVPVRGSIVLSNSVDYRGMPVLAELRQIEGTNWWLICKIDKSELTAPIQKRAISLILYILVLVLVIIGAAVLIWKSQQLDYYRSRFKLFQKSQIDEEQIRYMNA
ncbi:MAG: hypothetical protein D4R97_08345 [Bacteroidetes bacterium]|nr:MAG: hypothetical protein D4R97_08345 [Bacteroidota bacterium]